MTPRSTAILFWATGVLAYVVAVFHRQSLGVAGIEAAVRLDVVPGYEQMTPDTIWRRFISTSGQITIQPDHVTCRLNSRTYSPIMRSADLPPIEIPWWNDRQLRFQFA